MQLIRKNQYIHTQAEINIWWRCSWLSYWSFVVNAACVMAYVINDVHPEPKFWFTLSMKTEGSGSKSMAWFWKHCWFCLYYLKSRYPVYQLLLGIRKFSFIGVHLAWLRYVGSVKDRKMLFYTRLKCALAMFGSKWSHCLVYWRKTESIADC